MSEPVLEDFERFLLFMALMNPDTRQMALGKTQDNLVKLFTRISGWDNNRALSAFEVCVVKGFIDDTGKFK